MKHFTILNRQGLLTRSYGKAVPISKILIENKAPGSAHPGPEGGWRPRGDGVSATHRHR